MTISLREARTLTGSNWPRGPSIAPAWEDFKRRHEGWTGELSMGVTFEKFQATLAGGVVADAYFGSFETIQVAAYKGMFAPLDPYIARDRVAMDQYYVGSTAGAGGVCACALAAHTAVARARAHVVRGKDRCMEVAP